VNVRLDRLLVTLVEHDDDERPFLLRG
jgi:hypothetical protein